MVKVKNDLTGQQFGRLTVIKQAEDYMAPSGKHFARWLCQCSCSERNMTIAKSLDLKLGKVQSCGCLRKELLVTFNTQTKKKYNQYDYSHEYGVGYCSNTGNEFYFDWDDFDIIKEYCWNEHVKSNGYHILEAPSKETNKNVSMAQLLGRKGHDHKNRNPLDNRKENLRPATQQENTFNKSKQKNNRSGFIGVGYVKKKNMWRARITYNNKPIFLGLFVDKTDAIIARLNAEKEYFGEFAPQKHLFEQYGIESVEKVNETLG